LWRGGGCEVGREETKGKVGGGGGGRREEGGRDDQLNWVSYRSRHNFKLERDQYDLFQFQLSSTTCHKPTQLSRINTYLALAR